MESKEKNVLQVIIALREQHLCYLAQVAPMNREMVQASASHVLLASIVQMDQFCHYLVLLGLIVLENRKSLSNVLSEDMAKQQSFNQVISVQFVQLENIARMELSLETVQLVFIVIKELFLKTKTQNFVQLATTALLVQSIPQFAQQGQLLSKEEAKQYQIVNFARRDSIVLKEVHLNSSVQKVIIALLNNIRKHVQRKHIIQIELSQKLRIVQLVHQVISVTVQVYLIL